MSRRTVLIVPPLMRADGAHTELLQAAGFDIRRPPPDFNERDPKLLATLLGDVDVAMAGTEPYTREMMQAAPRLRAIVRFGAGYDAIDLAAADERNIAVGVLPGTNHESVAEHTLAMLLALSRGFPQRDFLVRRNAPWTKTPLRRLAGSTLGIVGLGQIAKALVRRVGGLGLARILVHTPRPDRAFGAQHGLEFVSLEDVLRQSDFVSLHLPLKPDTQNLINASTLALMKKGAILVNTARGGLIDEQALHAALTRGQLAGAGLDVLVQEPPDPDNPLLKLDNVLFSPHISGLDDDSFRDLQAGAARVVIDLAAGRWPGGAIVNLKGVKDWRW